MVESVAGRLNRRDAIKVFGGTAAVAAGMAVSYGVADAASPLPSVYKGPGASVVTLKGAKPAQPASMFSKSVQYEVVAMGAGLGTGSKNNQDDMSYLYTTASGDGTFSCRVRKVGPTAGDGGNSSAGIMLRSTTDTSAQNVAVLATDGNGVVFKWRTHDNDAEESWPMSIAIGVSAPIWVQLQKTGDTCTVSYSQDGQTWYNPTSTALILPSTYLVGLCSTTYDPKRRSIDVYGEVSGFTPNTFSSIMPPPAASSSSSS